MKSTNIKGGLKFSSLPLLFILICVGALSACGKKGPLYIPVEPESAVVTNEPLEPKKPEKNETPAATPEASTDLKKKTEKPAE